MSVYFVPYAYGYVATRACTMSETIVIVAGNLYYIHPVCYAHFQTKDSCYHYNLKRLKGYII